MIKTTEILSIRAGFDSSDFAAAPVKPTRRKAARAASKRKPIMSVDMPDGSIANIPRLTAPGTSNAKMRKNDGKGYRSLGLSMAPHKLSGIGNLCAHASPDCIELCLNVSGMAMGLAKESCNRARIARARFYYRERKVFLTQLKIEIGRERARAIKDGEQLIVRLNVISDVDWAKTHADIITSFPDVIFYGYTKNPLAMMRFLNGEYPKNYHLTFSRSEKNESTCLDIIAAGGNVAVVFDTKYSSSHKDPLPAEWKGFPVVDGDITDLRFLDPVGVIVGLRAKGKARTPGFAGSGFVVTTDQAKVNPVVLS